MNKKIVIAAIALTAIAVCVIFMSGYENWKSGAETYNENMKTDYESFEDEKKLIEGKELEINGNLIKLDYSYTATSSAERCDTKESWLFTDEYEHEDYGAFTFEYNTNNLWGYTRMSRKKTIYKFENWKEIKNQEGVPDELARFIKLYFPDVDVLKDEYKLQVYEYSGCKEYNLAYCLCGVETDDVTTVRINGAGMVEGFMNLYYGRYKEYSGRESNISDVLDQLDQLVKEDGLYVHHMYITKDKSCKPCLFAKIHSTIDEIIDREVYLPIKFK